MTDTSEVLVETRGPLAIVTLNRPKALNALTFNMIKELDSNLRSISKDSSITAVALLGAGEKAFCAGGDVVALTRRDEGSDELRAEFFREEYVLNHLIHTFPKPYIPLVDGISMGGGVGVSVHGSHTVATEKVMFAMPETAIGLFPDVGGSYFLPRLPGELGTYLALTNSRLKGRDVVGGGIYDAYVESARLPELVDALADADWSGDADAVADAAIGRFAAEAGTFALEAERACIDRCFGFDTVQDILAALDATASPFADEAAAAIRAKSPLMSAVSLKQLRLGRDLSFEDCMVMEYRMTQACMAGTEFFEGVRAMLVDKDRSPNWSPDTLDAVTPEMIDAHFVALGDKDLSL